jgi:hypothetical protein
MVGQADRSWLIGDGLVVDDHLVLLGANAVDNLEPELARESSLAVRAHIRELDAILDDRRNPVFLQSRKFVSPLFSKKKMEEFFRGILLYADRLSHCVGYCCRCFSPECTLARSA